MTLYLVPNPQPADRLAYLRTIRGRLATLFSRRGGAQMILPIKTEVELSDIVRREGHLHCAAGCEKSAGWWDSEHVLRCVACGAFFVECSPEICAGAEV